MKLPKIKKSTMIILLLLAVFAVVALLTTPLLNNKTNKSSLDLFDTEDEEEQKNDGTVYTDPSMILLFDNSSVLDKNYSAAELAKLLISDKLSNSAKPYSEVYQKNGFALDAPLPEGETITLFDKVTDVDVLTREEKADFVNGVFDKLLEEIHFPLSISVNKSQIPSKDNPTKILNWKEDIYTVSAYFAENYTYIDLGVSDHFYKFQMDKREISVDQTQSDEEIAEGLNLIRIALCEAMGVNLKDTKIVRSYDGTGENGLSMLDVYFYNKSAHPANAYLDTHPKSDYIRLCFDNDPDFKGDYSSDRLLTNLSIALVKYNKANLTPKKAEMLSLTEAEQLLQKGYVFGFGDHHACPTCTQALGLSDYDFVNLVYKTTDSGMLLPFYSFYKEIGNGENGNTKYRQVYVPAFAVSDLDEYFESQKEYHTNR